eukprot:1138838-Pelagomonas_calceolata.AAC.7
MFKCVRHQAHDDAALHDIRWNMHATMQVSKSNPDTVLHRCPRRGCRTEGCTNAQQEAAQTP